MIATLFAIGSSPAVWLTLGLDLIGAEVMTELARLFPISVKAWADRERARSIRHRQSATKRLATADRNRDQGNPDSRTAGSHCKAAAVVRVVLPLLCPDWPDTAINFVNRTLARRTVGNSPRIKSGFLIPRGAALAGGAAPLLLDKVTTYVDQNPP
jgi:hypothetical protein